MTIPAAGQSILGKTVGELIKDDVAVLADGSVIGTLNYVKDFTQFNVSDSAEQKGHYFPFNLTQRGSKMTFKKNGVEDPRKKDMDFDPEIIFRIDDPSTTFEVVVDGSSVVTLNFKKSTLSPES